MRILSTAKSNDQIRKLDKISKNDEKLTLDDIIDLTVVELYILNFLVRIGGSAVRFAVFNELNSKLERQKISRSSFYNSLAKLQERGFVQIENNEKGKGSFVKATNLAKLAVRQNNIFSIWSNIDLVEVAVNVTKKLSTEIGKVNSQIFASFDELPNIEAIQILSDLVSKVYLLADPQLQEIYDSRKAKLPYSNFENDVIKEPDNYFERAIISNYSTSATLFGVDSDKILHEIIRVTKPGGHVILICFNQFPPTNNFILDSVMDEIINEVIIRPTNPKNVEEDLTKLGIDNIKIIELKGYFITYGVKS